MAPQDHAEDLWHALFDAYPDAVLLVESRGRIVRANGAAAALFGTTVDELLQLDVEALVPDAVRSRHVGLRDAYQAAPTRRPMGLQRELAARRRDGNEVMVEIALSPLQAAGQSYVLAAVRGIAEYPRVKQALLRARYAEQVAQLGRIAVDARDLNGLVARMPAFVAQALQCEAAAMLMQEPGSSTMRVLGSHGLPDSEAAGTTMPMPAGSPGAHVMATGESVIVGDIAAETRFAMPATHAAAGFRSAMVVPISDRAARSARWRCARASRGISAPTRRPPSNRWPACSRRRCSACTAKKRCTMRSASNRWASSPAASRTTSTTC
jgi:PAS domain S-box-containing protein